MSSVAIKAGLTTVRVDLDAMKGDMRTFFQSFQSSAQSTKERAPSASFEHSGTREKTPRYSGHNVQNCSSKLCKPNSKSKVTGDYTNSQYTKYQK